MAYNVLFKKGTAAQFNSLAEKDVNTFYYVDNKDLYLGSTKLSNAADLEAAIVRIAANETKIGTAELTTTAKNLSEAVNEIASELSTLTGGNTGGISSMIEAVTGKLSELDTEAKGTLVAAINEVAGEVDANKTAAVVTVEKDTTDTSVAAKYIVKQGGTALPVTIDIPKDMVVSEATVRELTTEEITETRPQGTYIVLTIANKTNDKLYINVETLIDVYNAASDATQVQVAIDQSTNTISASLVAGGVTSTELADNAVVTAKIADGNVTTAKIADKNVEKAKLSDEVQASLGKADSAVQSVTVNTAATEEAKGTILVDSTAVKVNGLGSAAYTEANAYDVAGSANTAKTDAIAAANAYTDAALTWGTIGATE